MTNRLKLQFDVEEFDGEDCLGQFTVFHGDLCLTNHYFESKDQLSNSLFLPLIPLVEWLMDNYYFLLNEQDIKSKSTVENTEHFLRHSFLNVDTEHLWPPIYLAALGENIVVRFLIGRYESVEIDYVNSGFEDLLTKEALKEELDTFINSSLSVLPNSNHKSELTSSWNAVKNIDADQERVVSLCAALGLDAYRTDPKWLEEIEKTISGIENEDWTYEMASVHQGDTESFKIEVEKFQRFVHDLKLDRRDLYHRLSGLEKLKKKINANYLANSTLLPFEIGYKRAQNLRKVLGIDTGLMAGDLKTLLGRIGLSGLDFFDKDKSVLFEPRLPSSLQAYAQNGVPDQLSIYLNTPRQDNAKFHLLRALHDYLYLGESELVLTKYYSTRNKINRAFAAEMIAPRNFIQKELAGHTLNGYEARSLANSLQIPTKVIEHQYENPENWHTINLD